MPKGVEVRPTQDKVRQAIFNMLGDVSGKNTLDLFAGSGAFGIEALSRGAVHATFIDDDFRCVQTIRENLRSLTIPESNYDIIRANALSVMPRLAKTKEKFDLIFADPPYYKGMAKKCLINIDSYDILSPIALVVIERFKKDALAADLKTVIIDKERQYGDTSVTIFRKAA